MLIALRMVKESIGFSQWGLSQNKWSPHEYAHYKTRPMEGWDREWLKPGQKGEVSISNCGVTFAQLATYNHCYKLYYNAVSILVSWSTPPVSMNSKLQQYLVCFCLPYHSTIFVQNYNIQAELQMLCNLSSQELVKLASCMSIYHRSGNHLIQEQN